MLQDIAASQALPASSLGVLGSSYVSIEIHRTSNWNFINSFDMGLTNLVTQRDMLAQLAHIMQRRRRRAADGGGGGDGDNDGEIEIEDEEGMRVVLDDRCSVSTNQFNTSLINANSSVLRPCNCGSMHKDEDVCSLATLPEFMSTNGVDEFGGKGETER